MQGSTAKTICALVTAILVGACSHETSVAAAETDSEVPPVTTPPTSPLPLAQPSAELLAEVEHIESLPWTGTPMVLRASDPFTGDLDEIREREVLRVLVTYSRTNFFLAEGKLRGFEYEMFNELDKHLDSERAAGTPPLNVAFLPVAFDELLPALLEGRGDVAAAALTVTPEREAQVSFAEPYMTGVDQILVAHRDAPAIDSWKGLAGAEVHVLGGTSYVEHLERVNEELAAEGLPPIEIFPAGRGLKTEDLLELVHSGAFQYTVADRYLAEIWAGALDGLRLEPDVAIDRDGSLAWAVRPENTELRELLSDFARGNRKGTLIGNVLFKRYYDDTKWISNPLLDIERSKLGPLIEPLQDHSEEFGFDWRLMAAQAYQESQFDADAVSRSGAVGLMQLLPSTAEDMGVSDLRNPERNLYAGIKYMDWLRTHFFDEPQLAPEAQLDFCLAAYNAGPGRVRRWRAAAPDRGLDPDRWFGNVELLALEDVGLQPVRYVGNINKYFVLFTLSLEDIERHDRAREELESPTPR